jgi:hypothetical protein
MTLRAAGVPGRGVLHHRPRVIPLFSLIFGNIA